ncbi:MAG: class I SAM-dependent methyltransferase [Chloroflexota bacterium]
MTTAESRETPLYTLDAFASHSFYQDVNRRLVELTGLKPGQHVVDLGAGTGAVTRLLAEQVQNGDASVIAIEPSDTAIGAARRNLADLRHGLVRFVHGSAENLNSLVSEPVDAVFFCNAIHLVPEKEVVLQQIRQALREDGTFSFSTTFYLGAEPPESEAFYRKWMMKSLRVLKTEYRISPDKTKVEARNRLTRDDYVKLLEDNGFKIEKIEVMQVEMPLSSFESISEYSLWIEGVLPGVPFEEGAASLREGSRQAFQELGLKFSPRNWLLVVASRS